MAPNPLDVVRYIGRNSKRIAVSAAGGVLVLLGLVMLVLPGPGILIIALGFAVLGTEYAWAAAALERTKKTADRAGRAAKSGVASAGKAAGGAARTVGRRVIRRR